MIGYASSPAIRFEAALRLALSTSRVVTDELTFPGPRHFEYTITPVPPAADNDPALAVVVARDVTDARAAERAAADRERLLRSLADAIPKARELIDGKVRGRLIVNVNR